MNKRKIGKIQEQRAVTHLTGDGYQIIETNYWCKFGEIDLIGMDGKYLTFIEVKFRSNIKNGTPEEAIIPSKIRSIVFTAKHYMFTHGLAEDTPCRFDVVLILNDSIKVLKNAFESYF